MYRDWTYVDDITDGIVAAVDRPLGYEIINIGRGEPTLLRDFVKAILAITYPLSTLCAMNANVEYDQDDSYLCGC